MESVWTLSSARTPAEAGRRAPPDDGLPPDRPTVDGWFQGEGSLAIEDGDLTHTEWSPGPTQDVGSIRARVDGAGLDGAGLDGTGSSTPGAKR